MTQTQDFVSKIIRNVEQVIVGKREAVELLMVALCEGHVLVEDVPGVGKTMLARSVAVSIGGQFKRLQCTPDLLPNDVTGVSVFNQQSGQFEFRPGPIFVNILLADEINRATPRTQSALLEAMLGEYQASLAQSSNAENTGEPSMTFRQSRPLFRMAVVTAPWKRFRHSINLILLLVFLSACGPSATPVPVAPIAGLPTGADGYPWWNNTVFYEIFVRSFYDSDGDGIGDLNGVIAKLDYLNDGEPATTTDLGITGIWLMPIHPAVHYHGYDVTDYYDVNPDYGTKDDFKRLVDEAHRRGIRVIIDFVMNHTSDQHPWFIQSRDRNSKYRDWYLWSDTEPRGGGWRQTADGYYYGIFEEFMPDLNYRSPDATAEMENVARFWLQNMGVDGFRVDAAKHLVEDGAVTSNSDSTHEWFKAFRTFYKGVNPEAVTVGEMFGDPSPVVAKYTQGDELDLGFDFALAQAIIVGARTGNADGVADALAVDLKVFKPGQFAAFLSNHDQSRTMSQLGANTDKAKAAAALLLTAPGVPFIYYGEEIGMAGVKREGDQEIRTPMQWSGEANGGFTTGASWSPVNADYAVKTNVADESGDANSVLSFYRMLIRLRNDHAALRVGDSISVDSGNDAVFAQLRVSKDEVVLVVVNLSGEEVSEYGLTLASGPLSGTYVAAFMPGKGSPSNPVVNAQGGFDDYKPASPLPAFGSLIIQLQPQK